MTTTISSTRDQLEAWLGPVAGPALEDYLREATYSSGELVYPDLDQRIAELVPPRHFSPPPAPEGGNHFDVEAVDRFLRFCRLLRHTKGNRWARRPLELDLWQVIFVAGPFFGWKNAEGYRVYRTLWLEVPRKNGKSTLAAAINLYLLTADREDGAEVYAAAASKEQARAVYDVSYRMALGSSHIRRRCRILKGSIVSENTASSYKVVASVSDLAHGLNVHGATIDEIHIHKTRDLIETFETGTGSRDQPVIAFLTTAGLDDPGSIYTEKRDLAEKVAAGKLVEPELLAVIYTIDEADDPFVETSWRKANPGYGTSLRPEYIARKAREAQNTPAALNAFLRLHLNVRTGQVTRWIPMQKLDASGAQFVDFTEEEIHGRPAYGGLDLASSVDLAAAVLVVPSLEPDPDNEELEVEYLDVVIRAWTPKDTLLERAARDRAPYPEWVKQGLLLTCDGETIEYDDIELEAGRLATNFEVKRFHYDRWGSKQLVDHLRAGGLRCFDMGQGYQSMSAPMKEVERLILQRRLRHNGNPLLRWAFGALSVRQDPAGNIKPDRDASTGRIDPFVALVMAVDAWVRGSKGVSVYEQHGLETA
jgi:phage terminase large subunit-like protein